MATAFFIILIYLALIAWAVNAARKRGRSPVTWGILTALFGIIVIPILYILPSQNNR